LGRLRVLREQLFLGGERVAVVAHVRVADADPVAGIGRERASRKLLDEAAERVDRRGKIVAAKEVRRGVIGLHLARLVLLGGRAMRASLSRPCCDSSWRSASMRRRASSSSKRPARATGAAAARTATSASAAKAALFTRVLDVGAAVLRP